MKYSSRTHKLILLIEGTGFFFIMVVIWMDEWFDLPHVLFNTPETPYNFAEAILEVIIIGILGVVVLMITHTFLKRIRYFQDFYRICAGCKKVIIDGTWVSIEDFLHVYGEVDLTHGLCEECAQKYLGETI